MLDPVQLSHLLVRHHLRPGGIAVDATVGNGHDTLFLARELGPEGRVHGFDAVAAYVGHPGGIAERDAVLRWAQSLEWPDWATWRYSALNRGSERAELLVIERCPPQGY